MDRSFVERNDRSRERLDRTIARLSPADLERTTEGGWSVRVVLAHVAFWDRLVAARWREAERTARATPLDIADETTDLINEAALEGWAAEDAERVRGLVGSAATVVDDLVRGLPDDVVAAVVAEGRPRLVDRSLHRSEHLDAIERAVAAASDRRG